MALEDAGFEIRDVVTHLFGSGFPKSMDISRAIDKQAGVEREVIGLKAVPGGFQRATMNDDGWKGAEQFETAPTTPEAKQWQGWGTALKPASEHWILVRKPLSEKTVAANVKKHRTGGINIDASRIATDETGNRDHKGKVYDHVAEGYRRPGASMYQHKTNWEMPAQGRFPANLILDEEAAHMLDEQSGILKTGGIGTSGQIIQGVNTSFGGTRKPRTTANDSGGASRFFYCTKTSKSERDTGLDSADLIWEDEAWQRPDLSSLTETVSRLSRDISAVISMESKPWSTDLYGHSISEQYPMGFRFTIETVLKLITELRISNSLTPSAISVNIQDAIRTIEKNGLNLAASVEFISQLPLTSIREETAYLLGASDAVLKTLLSIKGFAKSANFHPTIKPKKLMSYLISMITPPGGIVLDPFAGSGSTGVAATENGFQFIGIEKEKEYFEIAEKRIAHAIEIVKDYTKK
jgi:hypothetical protein